MSEKWFRPKFEFCHPVVVSKSKKEREKAIEDIEIIQSVLSGDRNAYAVIIRKYEVRVRGLCLRMLSDATQADDAAQEIFMKVYQNLSKFKGQSLFSTWLYRVASNYCLDLLRKRRRQKTESWDALLESEGESAAQSLFSEAPSVKEEQGQAEQVEKLLTCLSDKHREVIVLRELQGLSYDELAEALKCSLDAVKSRLKRARQELEKKARHFLPSSRI